jgi:hypothetical protein
MHLLRFLVPLLFLVPWFLPHGTRRNGGLRRRYVFTSTREPGTQTPATDITGGSSSSGQHGWPLAEELDRIKQLRANSFLGHGCFGDEMAVPGVNGHRESHAGCDNAS